MDFEDPYNCRHLYSSIKDQQIFIVLLQEGTGH